MEMESHTHFYIHGQVLPPHLILTSTWQPPPQQKGYVFDHKCFQGYDNGPTGHGEMLY